MSSAKIAITVEERLLHEVDRWVREGKFRNRSQAIQSALRFLRLELALRHANAEEEVAMAEEWKELDSEKWPEY